MNHQTPLILAALSGGVDSSVVLRIMHAQYEQVEGISHRHWPESACCSTTCIDHCRQMCDQLGVRFHVIDSIAEFTEGIVEPFVQAYLAGQTPNPCVSCNQKNRFGWMVDKFLAAHGQKTANGIKIATGHYAITSKENGRTVLKRGRDRAKDQSYMLYRLSEKQLDRCIFPLGELTKSDVRKMALEWNLPSAKAEESQDICFVKNGYRQFLQDFTGNAGAEGHFFDQQGHDLGAHRGIGHYTRGQRKGLGLSGGPWHVINLNPESGNILLGTREDLEISKFSIGDCIWHIDPVPSEFECTVQVRYHSPPVNGLVRTSPSGTEITLLEPTCEAAPGQSAVFYDEDRVVGGGIILKDGFFPG